MVSISEGVIILGWALWVYWNIKADRDMKRELKGIKRELRRIEKHG